MIRFLRKKRGVSTVRELAVPPQGIPCVLGMCPSVGPRSVAGSGAGVLCRDERSVSPWQQLCLLRGCCLPSNPDKAGAGGRREKKEGREGLPKRR